MSTISDEEGIDFGQGTRDEWLASFGYKRAGNGSYIQQKPGTDVDQVMNEWSQKTGLMPQEMQQQAYHPKPGEQQTIAVYNTKGQQIASDTARVMDNGHVGIVSVERPYETQMETETNSNTYNTKSSRVSDLPIWPDERGQMVYGWKGAKNMDALNENGVMLAGMTGGHRDELFNQTLAQAEKMSDEALIAEFNRMSQYIAKDNVQGYAATADGYRDATIMKAYMYELHARDQGLKHDRENNPGLDDYLTVSRRDNFIAGEISRLENMDEGERRKVMAKAMRIIQDNAMLGADGLTDSAETIAAKKTIVAGAAIRARENGKPIDAQYKTLLQDIENARDYEAELEEAMAEQERLKKMLDDAAEKALTSGSAFGGYIPGMGSLAFSKSPEYSKISAAYDENAERIRILEAMKNGGGGFFQGLWNAFSNPNNITLGWSGLRNKFAEMQYSGGQDEASLTMMRNVAANRLAHSRYDEDLSSSYRNGELTGNMISFWLQIGATGGYSTMANGIAKLFPASMRYLGVTLGELGAGWALANTVGAASTWSNAMDRYLGNVSKDADGNYYFAGGDPVWEAIYKSQMSQTWEYGTEGIGKHLHLGARMVSGLNKLGAKRVSEWLARTTESDFYQGVSSFMNRLGIQGLPEEGIEEEINALANAMFVGDNTFETDKKSPGYKNSIFNPEVHKDIWEGMAVSMLFMGGVSSTLVGGQHAYYAERFHHYKHEMDKCAERLRDMLGDRGDELIGRIDGTGVEQIGALLNELSNSKELTVTQKMAAFDYIKNLQKMRGYNLRKVGENNERAQNGDTDEDMLDDALSKNYDEGYNAPEEEQAGVKERVDVARAWLYNLGFDDSNIESLSGELPEAWLAALSDEQREAVEEYTNARAAYEGMLQHVQDDMEGAIAESEAAVDAQTHIETGAVHPAVLKTGGEVWVVGGNVALTPEDNIDIENSDGDLIVLDPATGGKRMIHISDLASADEPVMADQLKQDAAATIQESAISDASNRIDGVLSFNPGDVYTLPFDDGQEHTITVIGDTGDGVNIVASVDGGEQQLMPMQMIQGAADQQREARIAEQAAMEAAAGAATQETADPVEEEQPEEEVTEEQPDEDAMPMNGDEVDWFATSPERGHRFLYDEAGLSPEEADAVVANSVKDAEKELEKVSKKAPKPGNAAQLNKYRAEKEAHEQQVAAAQAAVDYWKGVQATQQQVVADLVRRQADERAAQDAAARQAAIEAEAQYQAEQEAKKAEQAERGPFTPGQNVIDKWKSAKKIDGRKDVKVLADGTVVAGHYVLHEAGATTPSHDPATGWKPTEGFPVNENGGSVNDRDYERDRAAQEITIRMSETFDGRAYQDVPIISDEGIDYSGNGRTIAGDMAARNNTDGAYLETARQYSEKYGFTAEDMDQFQHPRVDFMLDKKLPYTPEVFAKFNAQEMKGQNLTESAVKLGKTVDDTTFNDIVGLINQFDTMSDFYADGTAPAEAISMLLRAGVITPMQHAQMFDGDSVSGQGKEMLENLLLGKAFEGNPEAIRQIRSMPSVRQQIVGALAEVANNSTLGDYSLEDVISQAVALVHKARNDKNSSVKQGDSVSDYARQLSLFPNITGGATIADLQNAMVLLMGDILNGRGQLTFKNVLIKYNYSASQAAGYAGSFFTDASPEGLLTDAIQLINNANKNEIKQEITAAVEQRKSAARQGSEPVTAVNTGDEGSPAGEGTGGNAEGQQSDLASPEVDAPLSEELNEFGKPFVLSSDGTTTFGEVTADSGLTAAPIKLSLGENIVDDNGQNHGYGYLHIDAGHRAQILNPETGFKSIEEFVETVARNYDTIREGSIVADNQTYLLELSDEHNNTLFIQLSRDGSYWNVNSAGIFKKKYSRRKQEVYTRPALEPGTNTDPSGVDSGLDEGVTAPAGNSPQTSEGKGSTENANVQGNSKKNVIQGLEGYTEEEILEDVRNFIEEQLADAGIEGVTIKGMALHGSRMRGDARPDSDLDVVVEYEGDISEDAFFNLVNYDLNFRGPNGIIIDINPITRGKSGTLEQYMERSRRYDEEKRAAATEATEPVQSTGSVDQAYTITPTKYTTKKNKELDVWLVKFSGEIDKKQATEIAKETRGWWDREQGGFLMRSEEAARDLAERVAGATSQSDAIPEQPVEIDVDGELERASSLLALSNAAVGGWQEADKIVKRVADHLRDKVDNMTDKELSDLRTLILSKVKKVRSANGKTHLAPALQVVEGERKNREQLNDPELEQKAREQARRFVELNPDRVEEHIKDMENRYITHADQESEGNKRWAGFYIDELKKIAAEGNKPAATGNKTAKTSKKSGKRSAYVEQQIDAIARELATREVVRGTIETMPRIEDMGAPFNDWINQYILEHYTDIENEDQKDLLHEFYGHTGRSHKENVDRRFKFIEDVIKRTKAIVESGVTNATNETAPTKQAQAAASENASKPASEGPKRIVSDDRMAELKARLRNKLGGQLNVGIDPELLAIGAELAVGHIERGLTKFADYAKAMLEDVGDVIRPYLKSFYNAVRDMPEAADYAAELTPYDEVSRFDVANFDKEGPKDVIATAKSIVDEQKAEQDVGTIRKDEVARGDLKLRPATEEDIEAGKQLYHNGEPVFAVMITHEGQQAGDQMQFTKPRITSVLLTNGKYVDPSELQVAEETEAKKAKKTSKNKKKDVSSQGVGSLFDLEPAEEETNQPSKQEENGLPRTDELRPEGLPADSDNEGEPTSRLGQAPGQEGRGSDRGGDSSRGRELRENLHDGLRHADQLEGPSPKLNQSNNHAQRGKDYAPKDVDARIEANIAAIELMQKLIESGKKATPKEMSVLRKFSGWGGLGKAFNDSAYGWREDGVPNRLRKLLGEEGYQQAIDSRRSAYYTPAKVIDALWDIARALGFKGGNVLEGSAGIGNIIGLMPADMSERSQIHAVEIDGTTGNILSLLYPDAKVEIQGFQDTRVANGSIDLAITNVPFITGAHVIDSTGDKDLSKRFRDIHDFCIAKNVRKLREGGIGIFITSSGTLDNSQKLRDWLVSEGNADVVGAFRMNNTTFGGTGATSDIIVVRKRVNGQKSANAIDVSTVTGARTVDYETGEFKTVKGKQVPETKPMSLDYNRYFVEHPEMMGGEMAFAFEKGETYRETSKALYPKRGINQDERLAGFINSLAEKDWSGEAPAQQEPREQAAVYEELGEGVKEGSMLIDSNGKLCVASYGRAVPLDVNDNKIKGRTKQQCFKDYCAIKDAVNAVLDYQTEHDDDAGLQPLLDKLNKVFDDFVGHYGHFQAISGKPLAISFLRNDMDFSSIAALESKKEYNDEKNVRQATYTKSDIFTRRVVKKEAEPKPTTVKDGVITSIYKFGRVDVPYISEQLGKGADEVKDEIIASGLGFENPLSREVEVSYEYLSGNVREKLRQAHENNEDGRYDANIKALEAVIPMNIPAHLIEFTLGSSWLDPKLYSDFISERTGVKARVALIGGTWIVDVPGYYFTEQNRAMGVESKMCDKVIYGHELMAAALQNKTVRVSKTTKYRDGHSETIVDKEATQACSTKIDEIRQDFKDWAREKMQSDPDMSAQVEEVYNESFNNYVPREIPDSFVPEYFGGAARHIKLNPHQAKAAIRATTQNVMLAHEVGTGKTFTLITTAMEMRRLGTARKPMIVVQNATVGQFVASAKELYPKAKVLTLEDADRTAEGRKAFYAKIKYNDWDMIVIPQSAFEMIPDSEERQMNFVRDKIEEKMLVLEQMAQAGMDTKNLAYKQAEREVEKLEEELNLIAGAASEKRKKRDEKRASTTRENAEVAAREMLDRKVDDVEDFDQMGIDAILVDEAHEYKHLGFATAMQRGVKGVDPSYSKKSQGVFLKCQSVMERTGGKNVVFATGTPISNTAAEIWTFMRYLMPAETLKDYGIYYFDDFVRNFGNITQMLEFATNGKFKENNRFAGYVNLPELVRIWSGVADTVRTDEVGNLKEKVPEMEGGKAQDIYLPQTRALRSVMRYVNARLEEYDKMSGKEKKANSHIPLTMYGIAKAAAVDARLVLNDAEDEPNSKTNEAVRQTLRTLEETADYRGTVAIFADIYQNKESGFNLYEDIRKKLIAQGVPEEQIVVMKSGMSVKKKLEIFDKVNAGEIRVIMGSTFTLGTGVNIQERLHTLIHVDAPNRPMDYTQRNGRILRQGNLHKQMGKPVRVLRFGVEDSLDVTAYQRLKTKGAIADSIMHGKQLMSDSMANRTMEEDEDVFGDVVAQLSGSEYALLKNQAEREVRKLEAKRKQWEADQIYIHSQKPRLAGYIKASRQAKAEAEAALKALEGADLSGGITIGLQHFNSADEMGDFIKEYNKKITEDMDRIRKSFMSEDTVREMTMTIGGFDFNVRTVMARDTERRGTSLNYVTRRSMSYTCDALGLTAPVPVKQGLLRNAIEDIMENVLTGKDARERIEAAESSITRNEQELAMISEREGRPFEQADELQQARAKLKDYEQKMKAELEAKESKYAEMDASVDEAKPISVDDEDDELYREEPVRVDNAQYNDNTDARLRDVLSEGGSLAIMENKGKWRIEGMPGEFNTRYSAIDEWRERAAGNVMWYFSEDGNSIVVEGEGDLYETMSRTSTTSDRRYRERLARQQEARVKRGRQMVDELANKLGITVRYVDDMSADERAALGERKLNSKGWYSPRTGEVYINLGRHTRLYDMEATFLHEVVAHKGLRRLFGKDFDTFIDNIYNNVNKGIRAEIDRMAEQQKSRATDNQRARHDDGHWRRVATEEYMARLAERLNLNHPEERTIWEKIREYVIDKLRKIGVHLAESLSDNDLRGLLWESYHSMEMEGVVGVAKGKVFRDQMEREANNGRTAPVHETAIAAEPAAQYTGTLFDMIIPQAGAWQRMMSNMSERELFKEISQDGPNVTSSYTDEYDRRHIKDYNRACDEIQARLERELPYADRLLDLLQDATRQWEDGAYKDERRSGVLAAIDTISRALDEEGAELPSVEDESLYRDEDIDWDAQASKEELAEHLRNIPDRVGIKPSGITTTISNDSDLEAMRGVVEDALYKDIVKNYNNPKVFGGYDPESGMIIVFTNKVGTRKEAESTWWHEKGHLVYDALSLKDKEECGRAAMDWLHKIGYLTDDQYNHYSDTSKGTEGAAWLTKYLFDYFGTDGILYGNFTGNEKIAKLAAAIQNYLKNGEENDNNRLRQPADGQGASEGRSQAFGTGAQGPRGRLNQEIGDVDDGTIGAYNRAVNTIGKVVNVAGRDVKPRMTRFNFQEAFQDAILSVKKLQQVVCEAHGLDKLPSKEDAWTYENRLSSINMHARKYFIEKLYEPMMKAHDKLVKHGATVDEITEYVICKHGLERNQVFAERDAQRDADEIARNGGVPDIDALRDQYRQRDYSGLTAITGLDNIADIEADAQRRVDEFEQKHGQLCDELWSRINDATKWTLRRSYDGGMMSAQTYIKVRDMFQHYVPLRGWDETTAEDVYDYIMGDRGAFNGTLKTAMGRTSLADDPFATIGNMGESAIVQGNRNHLKQHLWNMATQHPTDVCQVRDMWVVLDAQGEWIADFPEIPEDADADTIAMILDDHETAMLDLESQDLAKRVRNNLDVGYRIDQRYIPEHAVVVMMNGDRHVVYINGNPRAAQAINGNLSSDKGSKNAIRRLVDFIFKDTRRYYSSVVTSYNINFSGANFVRDLPHAYAMTFTKYGWIKAAKYIVKSFQCIPWVIKNQAGYNGNSNMDQLFREFVAYGGVTGYAHINDIDSWKADNRRRMARLNALGKGTVGTLKGIKAVIHAVGWFSETLELIPRFTTYCASRDMGMDIQSSIKEAKDITTNFNKKGTEMTPGVWGAVANTLRYTKMFFNPIVQGMYQWFDVAKDSKAAKARLTGIMLWMPAMGALIPYLNQFLLAAIGGDDDDDYFLQNEFTRRQNMLIWTGNGYAKIPIAPVFRELYGMGETIATRMCGRVDDMKMAADFVDQLRAAFSLEGQTNYREWSIARAISPEQYAPIVDIMNNENFTGKSLWYESVWNKTKPEYTKAKESTWSPLVNISRTINGWLGGDEDIAADKSGKWLNPVVWQHLLTNYGGGFAQVIGDASSTINNLAHGEPTDVSQWPIAKRFYTQPTEKRANWARYGIYKQYEIEFNKAKDKFAALKKRGLSPLEMAKEISEFAQRHPKAVGVYASWNGGINGADYVQKLKDLREKGDDAAYWATLKEAVEKADYAMRTGYAKAWEQKRPSRPEFLDDDELHSTFDNSENDSVRAVMAKEIATRGGVQDYFSHDPYENYGDEATAYWNTYRRLRISEDVVEDGKASQLLDDNEKETLKKIKKQLGQGGDDEQIMDEYRRERRRLIEEHDNE